MPYTVVLFVAAIFAVGFGLVWLQRRREAPLRREVRAQGVTFRTPVQVKEKSGNRWDQVFRMDVDLIVRVDAFEISFDFTPFRVIFGWEYYIKANEVSIKVSRLPSSGIHQREWIIVKWLQSGKETQLAIASKYKFRDAWDALVRAGAVPIGPPPQEKNLIPRLASLLSYVQQSRR